MEKLRESWGNLGKPQADAGKHLYAPVYPNNGAHLDEVERILKCLWGVTLINGISLFDVDVSFYNQGFGLLVSNHNSFQFRFLNNNFFFNTTWVVFSALLGVHGGWSCTMDKI